MFNINATRDSVIEILSLTRTVEQAERIVAALEYLTNVGWDILEADYTHADRDGNDIPRCVVIELTRHSGGEWEEAELYVNEEGVVQSDMDRSGIIAYLVGDRQAF
ncbi:hypothetical protein SEA_POKYPUPPY_102 [Gordonia phage PokyPuppy]|nr:hypothetical protein SEA_POKYPUPPY_102 [Gordonia phage PokyPuppy]